MVIIGGKFVALVLMAILNLGIGFGIARLLRRRIGPTGTSATTGSDSGQAVDDSTATVVGDSVGGEAMGNSVEGSSAFGDDLVELVNEELERAERRLQRLLKPRPADETSIDRSSAVELNCIAQELPDRLREVATRLSTLLDASQPPPELIRQATCVLDSLSALFVEAALQPGAENASEEAIQLASQKLITACQQARGTMIAVRFAEQHV